MTKDCENKQKSKKTSFKLMQVKIEKQERHRSKSKFIDKPIGCDGKRQKDQLWSLKEKKDLTSLKGRGFVAQ